MGRKKVRLQIIAVLFTLIVVATVVFLLFKAYAFFQKDDISAYDVITPQTAMIVKCENLQSVKDLCTSDFSYVSVFLLPDNQKKLQGFVDFTETLPFMHAIIKSCPVYLSAYPKGKEMSYVYVMEITKKYNKEIKSFFSVLKKSYKTESFSYKQWKIYKISLDSDAMYYCYVNGLLLGSFDEQIMYSSLNQISSQNKILSEEIRDLVKTENKNTSFHLIIQHPILQSFLANKNSFMVDKYIWNHLSVCDWSALDVSFKNHKIVLSGYLLLDNAKNERLFYRNKQTSSFYKELLPNDVESFFVFRGKSFSDLTYLYNIPSGTQEDFFSMMQPNSILTFQIKNKSEENFILIKSDDVDEANFHLFNCLNNTYENNAYILDTFYTEGMMVGNIDIPNFFLSKLKLAPEIKRLKAYTYIGDYIVFSDSNIHLKHYISLIKNARLMKNDSLFMTLDAYFPENANFLYYKKIDSFSHFQSKLRAYRLGINYYDENKMLLTLVLDLK